MRTQKLCHSVYQHQYHLVWGTKYRRKYLKDYVQAELVGYLYRLERRYPTLKILAVNTDQDHIHLQIEIPPNVAVSTAVQRLKSLSSRYLKQRYQFIRRIYLEQGIWSVGYFSSTIGLNEDQIRRYIEYQGKQDLPQQTKLVFS